MVGAAPVADGGEGSVGVPALAEGVVDACRSHAAPKIISNNVSLAGSQTEM